MTNLKEIENIVNDERCNLFLVKENLDVIKFLLDDPETIKDNIDLLYGLKNIIEISNDNLKKSIDKLDIPLGLYK